MAGSPENKGVVETYKNFNKVTRNVALGVAAGSVFIGTGILAGPALIFAAVDQAQVYGIDKFQKWRKERAAKGGLFSFRSSKPHNISTFSRDYVAAA